MSHDYAAPVAAIRSATADLEYREPMSGMARITLWQDVREAVGQLAIVVRDIETDATEALVEITRETGDDELETILGPVYVGLTSPTERWRGYDLLGALSSPVVDAATGELIRAVPLDVLRDVVAGCASEDLTSSKWRKTAVKRHLDFRRYYDRDEPRPIIRAGRRP